MEEKNLLLVQIIVSILVFLLFGLGVLFSISNILPYILIPLIIINIVFLFITKTNSLFMSIMLILTNILFFLLALLLFVFLVDLFAALFATVISFFYALRLVLHYKKNLARI